MEKIKAEIFYGPEIRQLIKGLQVTTSMDQNGFNAKCSFIEGVQNFLENHNTENYI